MKCLAHCLAKGSPVPAVFLVYTAVETVYSNLFYSSLFNLFWGVLPIQIDPLHEREQLKDSLMPAYISQYINHHIFTWEGHYCALCDLELPKSSMATLISL